ncbi:MAG: hypothetical protein ABR576_01015 [Thermoanaerobaculia bacterium]
MPSGDPAEHYGSYPLRSRVEAFRGQAAPLPPPAPGLPRREYLALADGIARHFAAFQGPRGSIIDPYEGVEKQYATPAFACAAAILCASGQNRRLLPACVKAMDAATDSLAAGRAADGHADFYTALLLQALERLTGRVSRFRHALWRRRLRAIDPARTYIFQPGAETLHNWNLVAVSGEWMRCRAGLARTTEWIEASLARHMEKFTEHGLYRDPGDPMAYDAFARFHVLLLLAHGYAGAHRSPLEDLMERGAWTSLFLQSSRGETPCGGRSGHHQWNEAVHAAICEIFASRLAAAGDRESAGVFRRSARLAVESVARWVRPSGDLWIVKNRFDPRRRHGYESYSFHSQYNLLTAALLGIAALHADESVPERPCPAEVGGFAFALQPAFHKVFANAGGMYVEIDTRADPQFNPTGILRIHHRGVAPQVSVSDGVSSASVYEATPRPTVSLAIGPAWRAGDGAWHSLAAHSGDLPREARVRIVRESPGRVELAVEYSGGLRGGAGAVRQDLTVSPSRIEITDTVEGRVGAVRQYFPLLLTDGEHPTDIAVSRRRAVVGHADGSAQVFEAASESSSFVRLGLAEPSRNGLLDAACTEAAGPSLRCAIVPRPTRAGSSTGPADER